MARGDVRDAIQLKPEAGYRYRPLSIAIKRALLSQGAVWLTAH